MLLKLKVIEMLRTGGMYFQLMKNIFTVLNRLFFAKDALVFLCYPIINDVLHGFL